jgi:hypothetical protein
MFINYHLKDENEKSCSFQAIAAFLSHERQMEALGE